MFIMANRNHSGHYIYCQTCGHRGNCIGAQLDQHKLQKLNELVSRSEPFHIKDMLFSAGDNFSSLYAIRTGSVKTYTISSDGTKQITGFHFPGSLLGLDAMVENKHASYAQALETAMVCQIPLAKVLAELPEIEENLVSLMSRAINKIHKHSLAVSQHSAEKRIINFILSLSKVFQQLGLSASEFLLTMSKVEIGNYNGLSPETVSRVFSKLQKNHRIELKGKLLKLNRL